MNILSLGCGNMGAAILSGIVRQSPNVKIGAIDPNIDSARAKLPATARAECFASVPDATGFQPDMVLLAVKPQQFTAMAGGLATDWSEALIVSVMAGIPVQTIAGVLNARRVVRVMPNLPALIGAGMSVGYTDGGTEADRDRVQQLFEAVGAFAWLDSESLIDACTAISGSGPGYLFAFAACLEQAALAEGIPPAIAATLTRQTIYGAAAMLHADDRSSVALKQAVTSQGGTTEAGLGVLETPAALPGLLSAAVRAAHQRARELASAMP
ncbi:MAG: pyrroline-5-carboxylate reductase [Thiothrix sp.]|nr:pyrroline-5-carboxylate reductase [Thiothrix sp.]HPE61017.1 pyrroline-5-carboxylate reductase [Thiolinea sp.]